MLLGQMLFIYLYLIFNDDFIDVVSRPSIHFLQNFVVDTHKAQTLQLHL